MRSANLQSESNIVPIQFEEYLRPKPKYKTRKLLTFHQYEGKKHPTLQSSFQERTESKNSFARWKLYFKKLSGIPDSRNGFEIYCEMASIHGFVNFIGARPWQRWFWSTVIGFAICMSTWAVIESLLLDSKTPTVQYTEGISDPAWAVPLPALTICNFNKISKSQAMKVADKFMEHSPLPRHEILRLFRFTQYGFQGLNVTSEDLLALETLLEKNNYTITNLLLEISVKCDANQFKSCKYKGQYQRCSSLIKEVLTPVGVCCAFNSWANKDFGDYKSVEYTKSCNYETGLSILMNPNVNDYNLSTHKFYGYEVLIHDAMDTTHGGTVKVIPVSAGAEVSIKLTPRSTYGTSYLRSKSPQQRRCYLEEEYKLIVFRQYSWANCFAECRSRLMYEKCGCVPPFWPMLSKKWNYCENASQITCSLANKEIRTSFFAERASFGCKNCRSQNFICKCMPLCSYNRYTSTVESTPLDRRFSLSDKSGGIENLENYTLLHVFYEDLTAEKFRLDVTESWLTFTGTIGGLAGLNMGISLVSIFELLFFVVLRPLCNWFTEKNIRNKIRAAWNRWK